MGRRGCACMREEGHGKVGCSLSPASEFENETTGDVHEDKRGDDVVFLDRMPILDRRCIAAGLGP